MGYAPNGKHLGVKSHCPKPICKVIVWGLEKETHPESTRTSLEFCFDDSELARKVSPKGRYKAVVRLISYKNSRKYSGSGVLIGPKHILTCAHNLVNIKEEYLFTKIEVEFGRHGESENNMGYAKFHGISAAIDANYFAKYLGKDSTKKTCDAFDFAIIELDRDVPTETAEPFSYMKCPDKNKQFRIETLGYPFNLPGDVNGTNGGLFLCQSPGVNFPSKDKPYLQHRLATGKGNSGGPIVLTENQRVIAVHTGHKPQRSYNVAAYVGDNENNPEALMKGLEYLRSGSKISGCTTFKLPPEVTWHYGKKVTGLKVDMAKSSNFSLSNGGLSQITEKWKRM